MLNPTPEQADIFRAVSSAQSNLLISACAGSGKTTTIVESLKTLPVRDPDTLMAPSIVFLAFNKSIADTLKDRFKALGLNHVSASTFHSLGFRALKPHLPKGFNPRDHIQGGKCRKLVFNAVGRTEDTDNIIRLVSLLKSRPEDPSADLCATLSGIHDLTFDDVRTAYRCAVSVVNASSSDLSLIDFDDMLYLPVRMGLGFDPMDWVFVDEAQDTNDIQLEILERLAKPPKLNTEGLYQELDAEYKPIPSPTRFIFVGDPYQAIYGFRGANSDSMTKISTRFSCTSLPLSVSFRCPRSVVEEAQKALEQPL